MELFLFGENAIAKIVTRNAGVGRPAGRRLDFLRGPQKDSFRGTTDHLTPDLRVPEKKNTSAHL